MGQTINPFGKDIIKVEADFCGRPLSLEVNRVGFKATSSVIARYGDTVILATAMIGQDEVVGLDYFPLSIDYEEKMYAAGKLAAAVLLSARAGPAMMPC
jgi:polyribonucleotide nucleotidyltransferase